MLRCSPLRHFQRDANLSSLLPRPRPSRLPLSLGLEAADFFSPFQCWCGCVCSRIYEGVTVSVRVSMCMRLCIRRHDCLCSRVCVSINVSASVSESLTVAATLFIEAWRCVRRCGRFCASVTVSMSVGMASPMSFTSRCVCWVNMCARGRETGVCIKGGGRVNEMYLHANAFGYGRKHTDICTNQIQANEVK